MNVVGIERAPDPLMPTRAGAFVISLDFELMWGVRDKRSIGEYGPNILGAREAIPRLLDSFVERGIACTWATVGLLFFDDRDELMTFLPSIKPNYLDQTLSPYALAGLGRNEREDPYHFGLSLIRKIKIAPRQEIATHTFSHYYCLEEGETLEAFASDLDAAERAAQRIGVPLRSIVFPRNQYSLEHIECCRRAGIVAFRGNEAHFLYKPIAQRDLTSARRAGRLLDSYINFTGAHGSRTRESDGVVNVPASRFLRPWSQTLRLFEPTRVNRILQAMRTCARDGLVFHLWFHPHNFGRDQMENFAVLDEILAEYVALRERWGWPSLGMAEVADRIPVEIEIGRR